MRVSNSKKSTYDEKTNARGVVSLVDDLLKKAVKSRASDVHFEPTGSELVVKFRLDGVLGTAEKLPQPLSDNVIARLKVLGGLLTYRNDIPQEGRIESTTLAALLRHILKCFPGKSIVTLEDPVEIRIEGITQTQITPHGQMTFPTALRSLLRQDPQVLMIGEIRDAETAKIAIEAGLTGHLLMSTMHSGTPAGALLRLLEMGIEPYQVTSSVSAVLNQRLIRKLCKRCKRKVETGVFEAVGCDDCFNTGFKGRVLIAEMVQLDGRLRKAILAKSDLDQLEAVLKSRGHTNMLQDGKRLVNDGITTQDELNKVCGIVSDDS